jgi:hypothetical protein
MDVGSVLKRIKQYQYNRLEKYRIPEKLIRELLELC